jgi:H+/Cl- antiporter ClcA
MQMDGIQKLGITLGLLGLFIMTLALLNVSFPNKDLASRIYRLHFTGVVVYANRTYLNQPEGIKTTVCGIRVLLIKLGLG